MTFRLCMRGIQFAGLQLLLSFLVVKSKPLSQQNPKSIKSSPKKETSPYRAWLRLNAFLVLACLPTCLLACLMITNLSMLWSPPLACSDHHRQLALVTTFSILWSPPSACSDHHLQLALITTFSLLWSPPSACSDQHLQHALINTFSILWSTPSACSDNHLQLALITTFRMLWSPPSACSVVLRVSWSWCSQCAEGSESGYRQEHCAAALVKKCL